MSIFVYVKSTSEILVHGSHSVLLVQRISAEGAPEPTLPNFYELHRPGYFSTSAIWPKLVVERAVANFIMECNELG